MQMVTAIETTSVSGERLRMPSDRYEAPAASDLKYISKIARVLEEFRKEQPAMPTSYISTFLAVAMKPGMGPTEYAKTLGSIQPIVSRTLLEIGVKARERDEPLYWVDREDNPENLRQKRYFLTTKGQALLRRCLKILQE